MATERRSRDKTSAEESASASVSDDTTPVSGEQTPPPTPADAEAAGAQGAPLVEDDSDGRVKVTREQLLRNSDTWLGVPRHVIVGVLANDDRDEMTLNAARKAVAAWQDKPTTVEEEH